MNDRDLDLSFETSKALAVHLGQDAGAEISTILRRMAAQIDDLKRTKVEVTSVVPEVKERKAFDW
jgi:hypothetical protein